MLLHSRVSIFVSLSKEIICFEGNNETTSYFFWRRKRSKKTFLSGQVLKCSINPNPFFIIRGFEPYPKSFSNRWKGLNRKVAETVDFPRVLVSRDTRWSVYRLAHGDGP